MPQGYARPELLVDTDWVAQHLSDPNVRIVDCDNRDAYRRAHIPGAVNPTEHYFKNPQDSKFIMTPEQFAGAMEALGIGDDTQIIAYDGFGSLYAARLWWCLRYYGHHNVKVVNGGWQKWLSEGRPASFKEPRYSKPRFTPKPSPSALATVEDMKAAIKRKDAVVLDTRSQEEWTGENPRGSKRGGHMPGAVHLEWLNYVTSDDLKTFKPAEELKEMFQQAGVTPEKRVLTL